MKLTQKEIKNGEIVPYAWRTEQYGRAEFQFCPIWKRGKLTELFIYPRQQPNAEFFYHIGELRCDSFQLSSWVHKGIENPWAWLYVYCKEHKCMSIAAYVPPATTHFYVSVLSTLDIIFERKEVIIE